MKRTLRFVLPVLFAGILSSCADKEAELIPRQVLFGNPDISSLKISHDGNYISYLAPSNDVMNVWIAPKDNPDQAKVVTKDEVRGIRIYFWAYTNEHIIYLQDDGGDENWMVHVVDVNTGDDRNITPFEEILDSEGNPMMLPSGKKMRPKAQIEEVSPQFPEEILIGLNNRDAQFHDIHRVNLLTGKMEMVQQNDGYLDIMTDDQFNVRLAAKMTPDGGMEMFKPDGEGGWTSFTSVGGDDMMTTQPITFDKSGESMYWLDSRGRNTGALTSMNMTTGEVTVLAENEKSDIQDLIIHPTERNVQAAAANYERVEWTILDNAITKDIEYLKTVVDGDLKITQRTLDDKFWTVAYVRDDGPVNYYLYDRDAAKATFLFTNRKDLEGKTLSKMFPEVIPSRDGKNLVSYLTLPSAADPDVDGRPDTPLPMVLMVHGGPWARDSWGYNSVHQWLANRGYAVLSVNYRGSTGFGKEFINSSNLEWAGKMHDDLLDAVEWAVTEGVADRSKVAIMGGSYGGYATLVGLTFTPDVFTCGVDIVGPSNLRTLLETIPPYWKPMMDLWASRVGDPRTEDGRAFLDSRSPLSHVDKISKPLLIGQGANDPRVKQSESDQIVKSMKEKNIPVTYVLYPDEGHGFARPENRLSFFAVSEMFLAQYLGGKTEPFGQDFEGSSIEIPTSTGKIPGLDKVMGKVE